MFILTFLIPLFYFFSKRKNVDFVGQATVRRESSQQSDQTMFPQSIIRLHLTFMRWTFLKYLMFEFKVNLSIDFDDPTKYRLTIVWTSGRAEPSNDFGSRMNGDKTNVYFGNRLRTDDCGFPKNRDQVIVFLMWEQAKIVFFLFWFLKFFFRLLIRLLFSFFLILQQVDRRRKDKFGVAIAKKRNKKARSRISSK